MSDAIDPEFAPAEKKSLRFAWNVCWLMFASTVLNYMDRQAVSVVGEKVTTEFGLKFVDLGWILAAFQLSYAFFQVPAGFLADRWNVRWTYAGAVLWWSVSAVLVAWSPTFGLLLMFRAILGVGEAFNWPCALKVTGQILPPSDRGLGNGIFNSGAAVGAVLTPLVITPLTIWLGWRWAFAIIGAGGIFWVFAWLFFTKPVKHLLESPVAPPLGAEDRLRARESLLPFGILTAVLLVAGVLGFSWKQEASASADPKTSAIKVKVGDYVKAGDAVGSDAKGPIKAPIDGEVLSADLEKVTIRGRVLGLSPLWWSIAAVMVGWLILGRNLPEERLRFSPITLSLGRIVRLERFWVMCVVSVSVNICWHFLVNWLPTYLKTDRGMTFVAGSLLSSVPFLAADFGNLGGGALSKILSKGGRSPAKARLFVVSGCVLLICLGSTVGWIKSNELTIAILALMALGTAAFMANYFAFAQEVSGEDTGLVVGILGGLGNLFAAGFNPIAGQIKDTSGGFGVVFLVVGLTPFIGVAALYYGWRQEFSKPKTAPEV